MSTNDLRSKAMGKIRGKNTKLEQSVSKTLWKNGFRFRKNVLSLYGKPDIAIKKYKVAIFIDSCFWHGCKTHFKLPSKNSDYWNKKINRNIERDWEVTQYYINNKWLLVRVWEHDLKSNFDLVIEQTCRDILVAKNQFVRKGSP
ncbi:very short patch repair endonuclease [Paenibacillus silvisoli]|uniref:very short patch repair endonuclease n=1 Tax=Paenibacillus silvisoli TaxID=3110539 RepID=UPI002B1BDC80|nr:very short patch repair endonuclease [Paenibacillus silvisoli]